MFERKKLAVVLRHAFDSAVLGKRYLVIAEHHTPTDDPNIKYLDYFFDENAQEIVATVIAACGNIGQEYAQLIQTAAHMRFQSCARIPDLTVPYEFNKSLGGLQSAMLTWETKVSHDRRDATYSRVFGTAARQFADRMDVMSAALSQMAPEIKRFREDLDFALLAA